MYYEYCDYNLQDKDTIDNTLSSVFRMMKQGLAGYCTDIHTIREVSKYFNDGFVLAGPVDYPLGNSDRSVRMHQATNLFNAGANAIDVVANKFLFNNGEYKKLHKDINSLKCVANEYKGTIRVIINGLDYSTFNCVEFCKRVVDAGADFIIPTLGYQNDDFGDNLAMSYILQEELKIPVICNGYMHLDKHMDQFKKSKLQYLRLYKSNYKMVYK